MLSAVSNRWGCPPDVTGPDVRSHVEVPGAVVMLSLGRLHLVSKSVHPVAFVMNWEALTMGLGTYRLAWVVMPSLNLEVPMASQKDECRENCTSRVTKWSI